MVPYLLGVMLVVVCGCGCECLFVVVCGRLLWPCIVVLWCRDIIMAVVELVFMFAVAMVLLAQCGRCGCCQVVVYRVPLL